MPVYVNALLIIPSGVKSCPPGSEVEARTLENFQMDKKLYWISIALASLGVLVSIYMTVFKLTSNNAMCLGSGDCSTVNASPYSSVYGIPVAFVGVLGYAAILGILELEMRG